MFARNYLIAFLCLIATTIYPQTHSYYHYTHSDGLASSTVYEIIQTKDGFVWFATANGLSKFDGKHFISYGTIDGLNSNSIISLLEGKNGEIYVGNFEKGINVLENGKIKNYCSEIDGNSFPVSYLMLVPPEKNEQNIMAYTRWGNVNLISEKKSEKLIKKVFSSPNLLINKMELSHTDEVIALTNTGLFNFKRGVFFKMQINELPDTAVYCYMQNEDGSFFLGTKGMIYKIKRNTVIESFKIDIAGDNEVVKILRDKNNNIWFSIMNKGFFFISKGSKNIIDIGSKMGLQNTLVNNYFEDNEGNIWICTFGKGVYCLNNLYLENYNENDGLINNNVYSIVKDISGKLLLGTFNGISVLENGRFDQIKDDSFKSLNEYVYSIKNINNEYYVCAALKSNETIDITYQRMKLHLISGLSFCNLSNGMFLIGTRSNYIHVKSDLIFNHDKYSQFYVFGDSTTINRINEIFEDTEKNIWIGTGLGLCKAKVHIEKSGKAVWEKSFFQSNPVLNTKINAIYQDKNDKVWFAGERGIANYDLKNDSLRTYTSINGYDFSSSTSIVADARNRMWIGNMKGLFMLDSNSVTLLDGRTGLPSDEVLSLYFDAEKNTLYVGTSAGITFLDIAKFDRYQPIDPQVVVTNLKAGDSVYTNFDHLVFKPNRRDISINFRAINFSSPGSVAYRYKLDKDWIITEHDFLNFISLKPGVYHLQIDAKAQNTGWGNSSVLTFEVLPRMVETIWFNVLMLLILLMVFISVISWRMNMKTKKLQRDLELSERINELKHQALSAMMNPHFISNSLNSVQYLVNIKKYEEANEYIAMMAKLMRMNLNTAGSGFILLSEEIVRLLLYLDLEKLRFQESFTYELITGADVDTANIMIPNMIIQPFTENSLRHGIANSGAGGLLSVSFLFEDVQIESSVFRCLVIKITDNGIGIEQAKKLKENDHISKGIQIVEERLRLLSTKMNLPEPIMFEDLSKRNPDSRGTEVIICLPPSMYKIKGTQSSIPLPPTV
jgi:ligand-binding sensor domain-containing protein